MPKKKILLLLLFIVALGAFFRFYVINEVPLGLYPDEAMNGNNALEAIATGEVKAFYPENNGREGLFINIQAISVWIFGATPWALRIVSSLFGTLTILGVYLAGKELFFRRKKLKNHAASYIGLLSAFFLATSYWHLNFSRIGFRAIMLPFFASFGIYFLLKGLRKQSIGNIVAAGICIGLGLQTYLAFRFMPFVLLAPLGWYLFRWMRGKIASDGTLCIPCAMVLFLLITIVAASPLILYFIQNPHDFIGRSGQVSVFSSPSPFKEFAKSNALTLGMFFIKGDCNWRHNYACQPELHPIVSFFFLTGLALAIRDAIKMRKESMASYTLLAWFAFMTLPATLTNEGLPHALRSIGLIPPVMIFAGRGAHAALAQIFRWLEIQKAHWPARTRQIGRVKREILVLFLLALLSLSWTTYRNYFIRWAERPLTYSAFSTDLLHVGEYLQALPADTQKYVIVNLSGTEVRGIPMPAQTVMFLTDSFGEEQQRKKNIRYLLPQEIDSIAAAPEKKVVIVFLSPDRALVGKMQKKFPALNAKTPSDFIVLQNY